MKKKNDFFDTTFDKVISIGTNCSCAYYLIEALLRDSSYPFDWLCNITFEKRIDLIATHFEEFMKLENLAFICKGLDGAPLRNPTGVEDKKTGTYFFHDFSVALPIEESFPAIREKYERRIARFYKAISSSEKTCLVYWGHRQSVLNEELLAAGEKLSSTFNKPVYLLAIVNNEESDAFIEEQLSEFVMKVRAPLFKGIKPNHFAWKGNKMVSVKVFHKIKKLGRPFYWSLLIYRDRLVHGLMQLIPVKSWRKIARAKWNKYWYSRK